MHESNATGDVSQVNKRTRIEFAISAASRSSDWLKRRMIAPMLRRNAPKAGEAISRRSCEKSPRDASNSKRPVTEVMGHASL
ncbi:MAG: hypothetical protein FJ167_11520 [Gammaproteobacteria bacterium]|nr:hypothetical protein [Gammaproteobacteria bacterium]